MDGGGFPNSLPNPLLTIWRPVRDAALQLMAKVIRIGRERFEILRRVVLRVSVPMVNNLCSPEEPAQRLLDHQPMLGHIPGLGGVRVIWGVDVPVPPDKYSAAFPAPMPRASTSATALRFQTHSSAHSLDG